MLKQYKLQLLYLNVPQSSMNSGSALYNEAGSNL